MAVWVTARVADRRRGIGFGHRSETWRRRLRWPICWAAGLRALALVLVLAILAPVSAPARAQDEPITFLSTQFAPVDEAAALRSGILSGHPGRVQFQPYDSLEVIERLAGADAAPVDLIAGIHGDMVAMAAEGLLRPVPAMAGLDPERDVPDAIALAAQAGGDRPVYIPWVQGTYLMAAHVDALAYLPDGADLNSLTYQQLIDWAAAINAAVGRPLMGFPAGPRGLMPRFLHGYLYPSYTGGSITTLRSPDADVMWRDLRRLWQHTNVRSLTYNQMHEPLLSGDVWIAWDHVARLIPAVRERPDEFVVFPAPAGPRGRGMLAVVIGLGIPAADQAMVENGTGHGRLEPRAGNLIGYLTAPDVEAAMVGVLGVFPIAQDSRLWPVDTALITVADAVAQQTAAPDSIVGVLPPSLGGGAQALTLSYMLAFTQIVLRDADIDATLLASAAQINHVLTRSPQPCWLPDPATAEACRVP